MALIHCPECGNKISERAYICPHCGYLQKVYKLQTGEPRTSKFAIFLKAIAIICMVSGMVFSTVEISYSEYQLRGVALLIAFLRIYAIFFILGLILWCIARIISQINSIYNIVYGLKLISPRPKEGMNIYNNGGFTSNSQHSDKYGSSGEWQCPKCGKHNTANDQFCRECGTYR